jgi:micrococcal nuclease
LVQEGYARIATFPPNVKYVDLFKKDQEEARKKEKGLWKAYAKAFDQKK